LIRLTFRLSVFSSRVGSYNDVLSSLSVSRACFVTAGAIDLKLCTYVPPGEMSVQTIFRSDLILGLAKTENAKSATTPELAGSSPNLYHMYI
jgi:hypothetical protein